MDSHSPSGVCYTLNMDREMKRIVMKNSILLGCLVIAFSFNSGYLFADVQGSTDNNADIEIMDGGLGGAFRLQPARSRLPKMPSSKT